MGLFRVLLSAGIAFMAVGYGQGSTGLVVVGVVIFCGAFVALLG